MKKNSIEWKINKSINEKRAFSKSSDQSRSSSQVTAALRGTDIKQVIHLKHPVRFPNLIKPDLEIW